MPILALYVGARVEIVDVLDRGLRQGGPCQSLMVFRAKNAVAGSSSLGSVTESDLPGLEPCPPALGATVPGDATGADVVLIEVTSANESKNVSPGLVTSSRSRCDISGGW
jgi:hypothetical protein